jgi:hypothetical protein
MARAMATVMADCNATEIAVAMVDGNRNGNGQCQQQWQWVIATATATTTATAMATATELAMAMEMATTMAMAIATEGATITKEGLPLHVAAMCSAFGQATTCLHPHGHKESAFTNAASWG